MEIEFRGKYSLKQIQILSVFIEENQFEIITMERPIYFGSFKISKISKWKRLIEVE